MRIMEGVLIGLIIFSVGLVIGVNVLRFLGVVDV